MGRPTAALGLALTVAWAAVLAGAPVATSAHTGDRVGEAVVSRLAGATRVETAVQVARSVHETATVAVLARADDHADALAAAPLARHLDAPLLLTDRTSLSPAVAQALDDFAVDEVVLLGGDLALSEEVARAAASGVRTVTRLAGDDRYGTAAAVAAELPAAGRVFVATGETFPDALAAGAYAARRSEPVLLVQRDAVPAATASALARIAPAEVVVVGGAAAVSHAVVAELGADGRTVRRVAGATRYHTAAAVHDEMLAAPGWPTDGVWLATGGAFADALAAGPALAATGDTLLLVDGRYLDRVPPTSDRLRARRDALRRIVLLGGDAAITGDAVHQLTGAMFGPLLPGGGRWLLPERRLVAFYGTSATPAMGVLGEGTPDEAAQRLAAQAAPYAAGDRPVLPTFEFITTIATRSPGADGDHSSPVPIADVRRYLDAARRHGYYVLLDFQPGSSHFLSQVRAYEELVAQPDVGVALDPEWRMEPGEVPGETIGSVDAAEVNQVAAYLADLVRRHHLPQKLLVVHQFRRDMVTDRDRVVHPDELAVTFHIDGFGTRSAKLSTYGALAVTDGRYHNGFKLFYDEDTDLFQPHEVLTVVRPVPDLVSYQ